MEETEVLVLGEPYKILVSNKEKHPYLSKCDGFCDASIKTIIVDDCNETGDGYIKDMESYRMKVTRHELVHAFLYESGLDGCSDWATNEEIVDWIALQFPKMLKAFQQAECI